MAGYPAAITRGFLACGLAEVGEFDEAFRWAHEGVAIAQQVDSAMSRVCVTDFLALTHLLHGEAEQAFELIQPNLQLCRDAEVRLLFSLTASILGYALTQIGRVTEAVDVFARGRIEAMSDSSATQSQASYCEAEEISKQCEMRTLARHCRVRLACDLQEPA